MKLSPTGRHLIQSFEGLSLKAYPDANGYSIGYGHFGAKLGDVITQAEAERLFDQDVIKYEAIVSLTTPSATQNQFDAMVSLAYNIGTAGFSTSTVARMHNLGDYQSAGDAFRMWNKSQGAVHNGLVRRREKERAVYLDTALSPAYPLPPMSMPDPKPPGWGVDEDGLRLSARGSASREPQAPSLLPPIAIGVVLAVGYVVWQFVRR